MFDAGRRQALSGRSILLLPRYTRRGPSSRLRMMQFVPALEAAGARIDCAPFFDDAYLDFYFGQGRKSKLRSARAFTARFATLRNRRADLYWIEKELFPYLPGWFEGTLARRGATYVVDYDDAIFHAYDLNRHRAVRAALGGKLDPLLAGATAVTAGNVYLGDYARRHGARMVVDVPTVVDPSRYPVVPAPSGRRLRIGWIGTPSNARYLAPVIAALALIGETVPVTLVTIGAPPLAGLPVPQETYPWTEEHEATLLSTIDVGIMPLPDDPFERGKCGYKLIQYMAAGRAVAAAPVGVNVTIVDPDVGLLAETPEQWATAIRQLANDPERRAAMGRAGRRKVEQVYSIDAVTPRLIETFVQALARSDAR